MNVDKLTMGEIATVEDLSGLGIGALGDENAPKAKLIAALAFVIKKREDSKFTFAKALALSLDECTALIGMTNEDEDPKDED